MSTAFHTISSAAQSPVAPSWMISSRPFAPRRPWASKISRKATHWRATRPGFIQGGGKERLGIDRRAGFGYAGHGAASLYWPGRWAIAPAASPAAWSHVGPDHRRGGDHHRRPVYRRGGASVGAHGPRRRLLGHPGQLQFRARARDRRRGDVAVQTRGRRDRHLVSDWGQIPAPPGATGRAHRADQQPPGPKRPLCLLRLSPLTTIAQPKSEMGRRAMAMALTLSASQEPHKGTITDVVVQGRLIVRGSSGPIIA